MRIARYSVDDTIHYGVVELDQDGGSNPDTVSDLSADPLAGQVTLTGVRHELAEVRLLAPVLPRSKVIGLVANCVPGQDVPGPMTPRLSFFLKPNTAVIGQGDAIEVPSISQDTALEGELAIVIGRICRSVPLERVPEVIFGYTAANDVTARDLIEDKVPWGLPKCWDNFLPLGPWIVTHLSLEEASSLRVTAAVDDQPVTSGTTKGLIHGIADLVSNLSSMMTLLPGDVILTGAVGGSAPIRDGQTVSVEIEEIGSLTNPVIGQA